MGGEKMGVGNHTEAALLFSLESFVGVQRGANSCSNNEATASAQRTRFSIGTSVE